MPQARACHPESRCDLVDCKSCRLQPANKAAAKTKGVNKRRRALREALNGDSCTSLDRYFSTDTDDGGRFEAWFSDALRPGERDECGICYESHASYRRVHPCQHYFGTTCILTWMEHHKTCPFCRADIR